jgi:hypothetical protein
MLYILNTPVIYMTNIQRKITVYWDVKSVV